MEKNDEAESGFATGAGATPLPGRLLSMVDADRSRKSGVALEKTYEFAARAIDEIGRLVGGWLKTERAAPT